MYNKSGLPPENSWLIILYYVCVRNCEGLGAHSWGIWCYNCAWVIVGNL